VVDPVSAGNEYLTVAELAERLKLGPKSVRNRMYDGTWQKGVHWFAPRGISPRFRWSAIVRWLEEDPGPAERSPSEGSAFAGDIPRARRGRPPRRRVAIVTEQSYGGRDAAQEDGASVGVQAAPSPDGPSRGA